MSAMGSNNSSMEEKEACVAMIPDDEILIPFEEKEAPAFATHDEILAPLEKEPSAFATRVDEEMLLLFKGQMTDHIFCEELRRMILHRSVSKDRLVDYPTMLEETYQNRGVFWEDEPPKQKNRRR